MTTSGGSLRDRQRAQIRADIRRAAFRLFVERGYDDVTTEEIATAAGVSPRTFFRHVPTKEEVLLAPVRYGGAAIVILLEQRPATESPDVALINAIITRIRSFDEADCEEWRVLVYWSNSLFPQPISASSYGYANLETSGRWTAASPKHSRPSRVPTGNGSHAAKG